SYLHPAPISGLDDVTSVAAGVAHVVALKADGTVYTWGRGNEGQLGPGWPVESWVPIAVAGLTNVKAVFAGPYNSGALLADGTLKVWGSWAGYTPAFGATSIIPPNVSIPTTVV